MRIPEASLRVLKSLSLFFQHRMASCRLCRISLFSRGQQGILLILAVAMLGALCLRFYDLWPSPSSPEGPEKIVLEIVGEIRNPGIHIFHDPPTLREAIDQAGGLLEKALFDSACSEILETGTRVNLVRDSPQKISAKIGRMDAAKLLVFGIPLDLNRASVEDLCLIPGIGESLAREIVAHRERRRGFHSIRELIHIKGVGENKYQSLKEFLEVR